MVRRTRFGYPALELAPARSRTSIFQPTLGFDGGRAPQELQPGYTPGSSNFVYSGGFIEPRSGLSSYNGANHVKAPVIFGMELYDVVGNRCGFTASTRTFSYLSPTADSWSTLSYIGSNAPDASYQDGWSGARVYDLTTDSHIAVLTNNRQTPKYFTVASNTSTFSDFTAVYSQFSRARAVAAHDNRLVWFNVSSSASSFPQRVVASVRGDARDYTIANGAFFEDLMEMRGIGQAIVPERDSIVLFTTEEIWRGVRRRDLYAYDFYKVTDEMGCGFTRTIVRTPFGIVFLARDLELYILNGDQLLPLGANPTDAEGGSRIQDYLRRNFTNGYLAWGVYNSNFRRYELYFSVVGGGLYPRYAFYYSFDNHSFFLQHFPFGITGGFELHDANVRVTWDDIEEEWNNYQIIWDDGGLSTPQAQIVAGSSSGTHYAFSSGATLDNGQQIDARWQSHAMNAPFGLNPATLNEVRINYQADSVASMSVYFSPDLGNTFTDSVSVNLSAASNGVALAPGVLTANAPLFEIRTNDRVRIARLEAQLTEAGRFHG